jgi:hypothetical protein
MKDDHLNEMSDPPIGIALTDFHLAMFFKNNVKILCLLNREIVINHKLDAKNVGKIIGTWFDLPKNDFGCYTNQSIIKYLANKESKKIWKIYLSKNDFEQAKNYCKVISLLQV